MRKIFKSLRLGKKGATAIEFAIVAPLLFFILFGMLEFGITLAIDSTLSNAMRRVAREAIINPFSTPDQAKAAMQPYMQSFFEVSAGGEQRGISKVVMCSFGTVAQMSALRDDPAILFESPPPYNAAARTGCVTGSGTILPADQVNTILVFAAEYTWGGFTNMYKFIIPNKLFTVTILKSEHLEE